MQSLKTTRGFTLTELLVVIGIIALLIGISLPAIQAVRERARGMACQDNIRQLGLGVAGYESAHGYLPTGIRETSFSIHVAILPFVGSGSIFDSLESDELTGSDCAILESLRMPMFTCPSDVGHLRRTSYCFSRGTAWLLGEFNGVFSQKGTPRYAGILDGLSNTVAISEFGADTNSNYIRNLSAFCQERMTVSRFDELLDQAPITTMDMQIGAEWFSNGLGYTNYTHYLSPGYRSGRLVSKRAAITPSSNHGRLIHAGRADGSVFPVTYSIDRVLWVQLGDIADGGKNPFRR